MWGAELCPSKYVPSGVPCCRRRWLRQRLHNCRRSAVEKILPCGVRPSAVNAKSKESIKQLFTPWDSAVCSNKPWACNSSMRSASDCMRNGTLAPTISRKRSTHSMATASVPFSAMSFQPFQVSTHSSSIICATQASSPRTDTSKPTKKALSSGRGPPPEKRGGRISHRGMLQNGWKPVIHDPYMFLWMSHRCSKQVNQPRLRLCLRRWGFTRLWPTFRHFLIQPSLGKQLRKARRAWKLNTQQAILKHQITVRWRGVLHNQALLRVSNQVDRSQSVLTTFTLERIPAMCDWVVL